MKMLVADIKVGKRYRKDLGNIQGLSESIASVGLLHPPVVLKDRTLVAGARRLAAVKRLGWKEIPVTVAENLVEAEKIIRAQGDENICREQWEPEASLAYQAALLPAAQAAAKARADEGRKKGGEAGGKGRPKAKGDSSVGNSHQAKPDAKARDAAAAPTGYSEKTLRMAAYVVEAAKRDPSTFDELKKKMNTRRKDGSGAFQLAVSAAYKRVKELEEQQATKQAAAKVSSAPSDSCDLRVCSMQELFSELRYVNAIDAIITDPPYPEEYIPLYGELAREASRVLKPDGVLAVMCGQSYLPRVLAEMTRHIIYRWTMAYLTPGGQSPQLWSRKVNTFWKPVLIFGGRSWFGDVVRSDVNDNDKRFHGWGQSESGMAGIVEALTKPGALVCDPFLGAGTTAVVCLTKGRRIVGCDIDEKCVETARGRVALTLRNL